MAPEQKIFIVMKRIREKYLISPKDSDINYIAGSETNLKAEEEILILNKLNDEGIIKIIGNFSSEYI